MKQIARRDRLKIYGDLLSIFYAQKEEKIVLTRIQVQMKVPFDRLKTYISELIYLGLIQDEVSFKLTEKGKQYLVEYERVLDFMKRMGIAYK
ncbi:MAG: winged helix-turn-helix domain-containing protein [Candidatus Bathyarchaeota archaeon]|jgi:predicted transcriptional regulator|nr:winged helix-turn-helix domain-containing protein [Candidatus Bathyarchaeota archaeon]